MGRTSSILEKGAIIAIVSTVPIAVGLGVDNVGEIFGVGGALITSVSSYLFPVLLVFQSRRVLGHVPTSNPQASPFGANGLLLSLIVFIAFIILSNVYELF